ncbi:MAG: hypothetical protein OXE53_18355 [Deltaproteobacteria bacterium]|nr:hypothetical protein [Deltaproteobacteria bacterium]
MTRITRKYHIRKNREVIYAGITGRPLEERLAEHRQDFGNAISISQVGNATTREAARKWEDEQDDKGIPTSKT